MQLEQEFDFDRPANEVEAGGLLTTPGWYVAQVEDVAPSEHIEGALVFKFKVAKGPHKGSVISETLFDPDQAEDTEKAERMKNRVQAFASRLALWSGETGRSTVRWLDAIGKTVVIEVTSQTWKDKLSGEAKSKVGMSFLGIFPPDHPKIPDQHRKALGLPPARKEENGGPEGHGGLFDPKVPGGGGGGAPAKAGKKTVDYGSL